MVSNNSINTISLFLNYSNSRSCGYVVFAYRIRSTAKTEKKSKKSENKVTAKYSHVQ